jgi:hypothetical protein
MDWNEVELRIFSADRTGAVGLFALPEGELHRLELSDTRKGFTLRSDPFAGRVKWEVRPAKSR